MGMLAACSAPVDSLPVADEAATAEEVDAIAQSVVDGSLNQTQTEWAWFHGKTADQLTQLVSSENARIVSLQVESASPLLFTVAMVRNTGSHEASWSWVHGKTETELTTLVTSENLRIVDLDVYEVDGTARFAALLVPNSGASEKRWWWAHGKTRDELGQLFQQHNARPTDLHQYVINGETHHAAVMIENSGADGKAWWWYFDATGTQVKNVLTRNRAYLTSIQPVGNGRFNVLLEPADGVLWWWWFDQSAEGVAQKAAQTGSRVLEVKSYGTGANRRFVAIFVNNSDPETTRIGNILRQSDGVPGFIVKRVGGDVEASLQPDYRFDPASSIKTLIGVHALRAIESSSELTLDSEIDVYQAPLIFDCPTGTVTGVEPMGNALREMLVNSDNQRTRAFMDRFGNTSIEQTARDLGLTSVQLSNYPGCRSFSNRWTLNDAMRLHEGLVNGTVLSVRSRADLFDRMPRTVEDVGGIVSAVHSMIDEEASALGVCDGRAREYKNRFDTQYKEGHHYVFRENLSISGIARLPACSGSTPINDAYVWGVFLHDGDRPGAERAYDAARVEPLRAPVRARLQQWASCTPEALCTSPSP